jgi:hypothetical protein
MKEVFFSAGMPRAGNTLLSSLVNQNKDIIINAQSPVIDMIHDLSLMKEHLIFRNFPDHRSFNNVFNNIFNHYYKDFTTKYIIDRGPWGTPGNLKALKQIIEKPKFIILYRPVLEVLASFIDLEKPTNIEKRCFELMHLRGKEGMIDKSLYSIHNILKEKEDYLVIYYNNLVIDPLKEIKKIYEFLNVPFENIVIDGFNQFKVNDIMYDDSVYAVDYHKIRTDKIMKINRDIEKVLPKEIIKLYSNRDIL